MKAFLIKTKQILYKIYKNEYFRAFALIYLFGFISFSVCAIAENFTLPLSGDYVLQTYAFYSQGYKVFWEFIKTGQYPLFDFSNFLGANYLGTQSFYYVFSPLFYLLCLWPEKLLYQGIFFHMIFKFALGGFFMYILLKRYFSVSHKMSVLGGLIYAFSGWSLFYLWFHFGDVMAFFPLFIMGIEMCLKERKGWLLAISTFLCGLSNYFFLVNFIIFGVLYALYRWIYIYGINNKKGYSFKTRYGVLLQGIAYCFVGVMMACICLLPSLHVVMETSRNQTSDSYSNSLLAIIFMQSEEGELIIGELKAFKDILKFDNLKDLFNLLFVWQDRTVNDMTVTANSNIGYIISNWLFMNTNCWDNILFDNQRLDNALGGFFISTPLTMLLIPSIVKVFKTKRPWAIFGVVLCLALPFFPITSHMAFGFTSLYGRWQLWLVLLGIIFIIPTLDKYELVNRRWITVNLIVNYVLAIIVFAISKDSGKYPTSYMFNLFGTKVSGMVVIAIVELIVMGFVWFVYRFKLFKPAVIKKIMIGIVVIEVGASSVITIEQKSYYKYDEYYVFQPQYEELNEIVDKLKEEDDSFYRIMNTEATRSITNLPSQLNYAGASSFNSTYAFALDEFKNTSRMAYGGTWSMANHEKRYWLDQYIGTKYYIIDKLDPNNDNTSSNVDKTVFYDGRTSVNEQAQSYRLNLPWNYELYKEGKYYDVYINKNFTSIGYSVDNYISTSNAKRYATWSNYYEQLYSTTAIIHDEDIESVSQTEVDGTLLNRYNETYKTFDFANWDLYFSPREDAAKKIEGQEDVVRPIYKLNGARFNKEEISKYLKDNQQFFHTRWYEKNYFGDQLIMELKEGKQPLASKATKDNMAYLDVLFKMGPKVLISLFNGDKLVTQDAHMNSNSSLGKDSYEWKAQRGFYVDQQIDKIVIEFVGDAQYNQVFVNQNYLREITINYDYQNNIELTQNKIKENMLQDVTYHNNKFTFKTNNETKKVVVTNIPYDEGWTLKSNGQKVQTFIVNGGFVGFVSESGLTEYELSYFTPNLKEGIILFIAGLMLFILLAFIYKNKKIAILDNQHQIEKIYYQKQEIQEKLELEEFKEIIRNKTKKIRKED